MKSWRVSSSKEERCSLNPVRSVGTPLFEYKGETQCVICPLETSEEHFLEPEPLEPVPAAQPPVRSSAPATAREQSRVVTEIEQTIIHLCERIRREQRVDGCLTLMMAVERGAEALATLDQR